MKTHDVMRYDGLRVGLLLAMVLHVLAAGAAGKAKPNILWLIAEDMSPDIGCYGNKVVTTPNLDRLAAGGMRFTRVFTTGPACSPSRTALATGVYQTTLGAYHMRYSKALRPALPSPVKILPELMRANGYHTGNIRGICGTGTGKDDWLFKTSQTSWDTRSWSALIKRQPFFAQINFKESHRAFRRGAHGVAPKDVTLPPYYPDHAVSRADWAGYLESVNVVDERVGAVLDQLKRDGLADSTIVVFISDHGRPMIRGKNWLYDSGTHIPMLIHIPRGVAAPERFKRGGVSSELLSAVDLVAETVLMAGGQVPKWMQGRSFLRKDSVPRTHVLAAVDRIGNIDTCSRAVRTQRFKYIRNFKTPGSVNACTTAYRRAAHPLYHLLNIMGRKGLLTPVQAQLLKPLAAEELYDLEKDPYETKNLIGDETYKSVHKQLRAKLTDWMDTSKDRGLRKDSDAIVKHFRDYGISTTKMRAKHIEALRSSVAKHFDDADQ